MKSFYTKKFFKAIAHGSQRSAEEIVPSVMELLRPASVIDVGCGLGVWLKAFVERRYLAEHPRLLQEQESTCPSQLCIAHPRLVDPQYMSPRKRLEALPVVMWNGVKRQLARFKRVYKSDGTLAKFPQSVIQKEPF
jgi:hypothetical protein